MNVRSYHKWSRLKHIIYEFLKIHMIQKCFIRSLDFLLMNNYISAWWSQLKKRKNLEIITKDHSYIPFPCPLSEYKDNERVTKLHIFPQSMSIQKKYALYIYYSLKDIEKETRVVLEPYVILVLFIQSMGVLFQMY